MALYLAKSLQTIPSGSPRCRQTESRHRQSRIPHIMVMTGTGGDGSLGNNEPRLASEREGHESRIKAPTRLHFKRLKGFKVHRDVVEIAPETSGRHLKIQSSSSGTLRVANKVYKAPKTTNKKTLDPLDEGFGDLSTGVDDFAAGVDPEVRDCDAGEQVTLVSKTIVLITNC
ncbi:hypothetical protein EV363DRAFT_1156903 [Boletus edulis]|uniref:Uncharacterized protein n=1 Tax=Boletus edulis BED1 TaxID=1328754 RepID=A0AAD4BPI7_BOLED|nr:hypothetical protein EV363DRAFT_1156903 [Boletus edulis]KAF8436060.1 hypothetical protein L210DRAFT_935634 [Boletus edulis BED1]